MFLLAMDPSFAGFGLARYNTESNQILLDQLKVEMRGNRFVDVYKASMEMRGQLKLWMSDRVFDCILSEEPMLNGIWSVGLSVLSTGVIDDCMLNECVRNYCLLHPSYLLRFKGKKAKKSVSVEFAKKAIEVLKSEGFIFVTRSRVSHNEAEALMYLLRLIYRTTDSDRIKKLIVGIHSRYNEGNELIVKGRLD